MFHLKYVIAIIMINASLAQWTITHYEGYDRAFTQNNLDNYIKLHCQAYNLPIIAQQDSLQKVISLKDFQSFAKTKILVEFIVPIDSEYLIKVQNATIDSTQSQELGYGFSMINECFNASNYKMLSFNYELEGKNYTEISIFIQLSGEQSNQQKRYVGIKQIHIFQMKCPKNCQECEYNINSNNLSCLECQKNFIYQSSQNICQCLNFEFQNQCIKQCPEGYAVNVYSGCTKVEFLDTQIIGQDQNLRLNDSFEQKIQLKNSSQIRLEIDLILSHFKAFQQFDLMINDVYEGGIANYYSNLYISIYNISETKCQYSKNCTLVKLQTPLIDVNSSVLYVKAKFNSMKVHKPRYKLFEDLNDQKQSIDSEIIIKNIELTQLLIDETICSQENCKICDQKYIEQDECKQCKDGFYLFENQCVKQCPEISIQEGFQCKSFLDKQSNSKLLVKDVDIAQYNWAGDISLTDTQSQFQFRFNKTNLLFGGKWKRQEFTKILVLEPHYALTYTFTVSYIDLSNLDEEIGFFYQLDGGEYNFINPKDLIQIDGDANKPDSIVQYNKYFSHTNNDIMITIGCNTNGYCFLQDYYLIIHKCTPYCKSCTGPSKLECLEYTRNSYEFDYKTKQCKSGYFQSEDKTCKRCDVTDCSECTSQYKCSICKKGCQLHLQGSKCICEVK